MASSNPSYWCETSRPLTNLAFVAPVLVAYETGLVWLGPAAMRNGADVWLRRLLESLGFSQYFLLPALIAAILLAWHHICRDRWQVRGNVLYGMLLESIAFGCGLLLVAQVHQSLLSIESEANASPLLAPSLRQAVSYLGAGVYEELVFRMIALSGLVAALRRLGGTHQTSWTLAILLSSMAFAAAHYPVSDWILIASDPSLASSFVFRFTAGVIFCLLFLFRGFGIAVGAHALYDILVGCG